MLDEIVIEVLSALNKRYPNDLDRMEIYLAILPSIIGYGYRKLVEEYLQEDIALNMAYGLMLK